MGKQFMSHVHGFKPGRSLRIFQGEKILSTPSFGREVKPFVPCPIFAACKRTQMCKRGSRSFWSKLPSISRPSSSSFHYQGLWWRHLVVQGGTNKDQGLHNKPQATVHRGALAAGTLPQYNTLFTAVTNHKMEQKNIVSLQFNLHFFMQQQQRQQQHVMLNRMKVKFRRTAYSFFLISSRNKLSFVRVFPKYLKFTSFSKDNFVLWFSNKFFEVA